MLFRSLIHSTKVSPLFTTEVLSLHADVSPTKCFEKSCLLDTWRTENGHDYGWRLIIWRSIDKRNMKPRLVLFYFSLTLTIGSAT